MAVTIGRSQYRNLSCKLGKKNKITKVTGNEYIIDSGTSTTYEEGAKECTPAELGGSAKHIEVHASYTAFCAFNWSAPYYLRREIHYRNGSYTFTITGKTITNIDQMTANYTLYYKKYTTDTQLIDKDNYNKSASNSVFSSIAVDSNRPESAYDEDTETYSDYDESTATSLPSYDASGYYDSIGSDLIGFIDPGGIMPEHYCRVQFLSKSKNSDGVNYDYKFRVDYQYAYATGRDQVALSSWTGAISEVKNEWNEVVKIAIEISGYTVEKEAVMSGYCPSGDESYVLELQTNELMQQSTSSVTLSSGEKVISFTDVATDIIDAYKDNRLIATFDLVNNRKLLINGETRYLRSGDKIKLKGIDDNYISSQSSENGIGNYFEIIKANSKWDGFYYKEITAKEILNSPYFFRFYVQKYNASNVLSSTTTIDIDIDIDGLTWEEFIGSEYNTIGAYGVRPAGGTNTYVYVDGRKLLKGAETVLWSDDIKDGAYYHYTGTSTSSS